MTSDEAAAWSADVDTLIGLRGGAPLERGYREPAGGRVVAGRWLGCYLQPEVAFGPKWMDLELDIGGVGGDRALRADGVDALGRFALLGRLDTAAGEARFLKQYVGGHSVRYAGVFDGSALRGIWHLGVADGVFALWSRETLATADVQRGARSVHAFAPGAAGFLALLTTPFRARTILRHTRLIRRFERLFPELARWAATQ